MQCTAVTQVTQSRIVSTRTRLHLDASVTQQHTRAHMYATRFCIYRYICVCLPSAQLAVHTGGHPCALTMSPAASSARAIARTCTWRHMQPQELYIYIYIYTHTHTDTHRYTHTHTHARARMHAQALVATHMRAQVLHVPQVIRMKTMIYKYTHVAIYRFNSDIEGAPELIVCAASKPGPSASGTPAVVRRRAGSGAYIGQRGDTRSVPRADVRVERRRTVERLRAEPHAVHADGKGSHGSAPMRGRPNPHTRGTHTQTRTMHTYMYIYIYV